MIEYGDADVMVCGGADHVLTPLALGGFAAARALSVHMPIRKLRAVPGISIVMVVLGEGAGFWYWKNRARQTSRSKNLC